MSEQKTAARIYYLIFGALVGLTLLTVGLGFLELGVWHTPVGLLIAACKGVLVVLFFMHLLQSKWLIWLILGAGLFWLSILIGLTLSDYLSRPWMSY